jgi:hypothetical protein
MSPDQESIAQWLTNEAPSLQGAYAAALRLLADTEAPGRTQMICHAGRDLCTGLQDLKGVSKERADPTAILREVDSAWRKEGLDALRISGFR